MKQRNKQQTIGSQEKKHSDNLILQMMRQPCDLATLWKRAADAFPQNRHKRRIHTAIVVILGVVIGALAMHFLSSPERWIRL